MSVSLNPLPCPFCGGTDVYAGRYSVKCDAPTCLAEGPSRPSRAEAVAAWNRRPPIPGDADTTREG